MFEQNDQKSKQQLAQLTLILLTMIATIAHVIHWYQADPWGLNRIGSGLTALISLIYLLWIDRNPQRLEASMSEYLVWTRAMMIVISAIVMAIVINHSESLKFIDLYPPFTAFSFLWITMVVIFIPYQKLINFVIWGCTPLSVLIVLYLFFHPDELKTGRGLDLLISNSIITITYIIISLFYASLQVNYKKLSQERLNYYTKIIETQNIRQRAFKEAFNTFHNGPLQSLALLIRDINSQALSPADTVDRLAELDTEMRQTGEGLTKMNANDLDDEFPSSINGEKLQLGSGVIIDLYHPLHTILYNVYGATILRTLPYFQSIKVKIRSFDSIAQGHLTLEQKRDIGFWLEEALCNVGKHAEGVTRLAVTGCNQGSKYVLTVEDNGIGLKNHYPGQGTTQGLALAQKLGGNFTRESLAAGGVKCQLTWPLALTT